MSETSTPKASRVAGEDRADALVSVLSEITRAVAGTLELKDVFSRVAEAARRVLAFDAMGVNRLEPEDVFLMYAIVNERGTADAGVRFSRGDVSPAIWSAESGIRRIDDARETFDPSYALDRQVLENGRRSILVGPLRIGAKLLGIVWFAANRPGVFSASDECTFGAIADLIALALEHERLAGEARRADEARADAERLEARVLRLTEELELRDGFHRIAGVSRSWRDVLVQASKVAPTETTVLLLGESGTGKEVIARAVHRASPRASGPFVAINCAALPDQLLESELFGYEKGAFTGATSARPGRLEQAAGGVLFLDEVGEMSPVVQAKFLRVLQERDFQHLGGAKVLKADVRVVAATNRDLHAAIARGMFREDLYYRLHVFEIRLPPLRERKEDILPLTERFLEEIGRTVGLSAPGISREAKELLLAYPWPGNVRELRNALERAAILCEGGLLTAAHLPISVSRGEAPAAALAPFSFPPGGVDLESVERSLVVQALERAGQNKSKAARLLGLTRAQLYSRIEKYGIR